MAHDIFCEKKKKKKKTTQKKKNGCHLGQQQMLFEAFSFFMNRVLGSFWRHSHSVLVRRGKGGGGQGGGGGGDV